VAEWSYAVMLQVANLGLALPDGLKLRDTIDRSGRARLWAPAV
jgi:hypothetical protein